MIDTDSIEYHKWYNDVDTVRKMVLDNGGTLCPTCCTPFDKGKHRKLIDTCGHELCYTCINSDHCPLCLNHAQSQYHQLSQDGGIPRPRLKTNGHFTTYMQVRDKASPERPVPAGALPPKAAKPCLPSRTPASCSPRMSRPSRNYRHMKWPNPLMEDSHTALSDDEVQSNSKHFRNHDLYTRLGLLLGDRTPLSSSRVNIGSYCPESYPNDEVQSNSKHFRNHDLYTRLGLLLGDRTPLSSSRVNIGSYCPESYPSISSLASSEANTTNTSPLSTLTDSSDPDHVPRTGGLRSASRDQSSDSVVSLISTSTGNSSCSSPFGTNFQRHTLARTSDSFVQIAKRNLSRRQAYHNSDDSFSAAGRNNASKIINKTLKPLYFEVPQPEPEPLFIGRQWLFKEIEQEISDPKSKKAIAIVGGPGSGKTAIVSQLVEHSSFRVKKEEAIYHDIQSLDGSDYNMSNSSSSDSGLYQSISTLHHSGARSLGNRLVAYHLCQADNNITCMVPEFVHSVAAQLCKAPQLTAYRDLIARDIRLQEILSLPSCISDPSAAFVHGIIEPLSSLRSRNRIPNATCLLVVDGLNEAEYHRPDYGDTIASFLVHHFEAIPSWLKVLVTVRTSFSDLIKRLPTHYISLDKVPANENIQKDLCNYVMHRINTSPLIRANITINNSKVEGIANSKFAAHLSNLSKGCMLYIRLTLDLIERGHLVVKSSSYRVLPVCLSEVYMLSFNLKFTTIKSYEKVAPILQICLASLYPLTLQELFYTLNAKCISEGISWDSFMGCMDVLISNQFMVTRQDSTVMFVHPSMREWLLRREENESNKFLCDVRGGHAAIAFRISRAKTAKTADDCLELGHHVLKAHIYKNSPQDILHTCLPRDLQAYWLQLSSGCIQSGLGSIRNLYSPNVKVSRLLLLAGADPNLRIQLLYNMPIVAVAAEQGFLEMVSQLVEFGADVNATSNKAVGALALASGKGFIDIVRLLTANGAKINQVDHDGKCPIIYAAMKGHLDIIMHLFQCDWPIEDKTTPSFAEAAQSCLVTAAHHGHANVCEFLLDMPEVKVNGLDALTGHSALTAASCSGHLQVCSVLLRRGASVSSTNRQKDTPLLCAASEGNWEVAEKLMMHGASVDETDALGRTPLMLAAIGGHPVLELLLSKGASSEVTDRDGMTALSWACMKGHYQAIQCLLSHGFAVNLADKNGRTPLDFAAFNGDPEIVQLLLDSGASMENVDSSGMKPLDRAIGCKNAAAVVRFLHKGAKLGSKTWAMAEGNPEILALLFSKLLEDATVLCKRGRLKDATHRYQYALKKFQGESELERDPRFGKIKYQLLLGLSRCRRKMDEPKLAVEAAEEAISLKPKSFEGYYARGRAHEALGLNEKALSDILEALRYAPQNQEMKRALVRLKEQISNLSAPQSNYNDDSTLGFSGPDTSQLDDLGSTETIDRLCNMTLNLVEDLNQLKDRMQDSGCESIH